MGASSQDISTPDVVLCCLITTLDRLPRPQFTLRRLLAVLTLGCVALGTWSLYANLVAQFVTADAAVAGQLIRVRGRFLDLEGVDWETCYVQIRETTGRRDSLQNRGLQVRRAWPGLYNVDIELPPVEQPGKYRLVLLPMTGAVMKGRRNLAEDAVVGLVEVQSAAE